MTEKETLEVSHQFSADTMKNLHNLNLSDHEIAILLCNLACEAILRVNIHQDRDFLETNLEEINERVTMLWEKLGHSAVYCKGRH